MECPNCGKLMDYLDHGKCSHCNHLCGCSFSPTSAGDYCRFHRPGTGLHAKRESILAKIKPIVDNWLRHNLEAKTTDEVQLYESFARFFMLVEANEARRGR